MSFKFHIGCSHPSSLGGPALGVRPSHVRIIMPRVHIRVTAPPSHNSMRFWIKFSYKSFYGDHYILITEHMAGFRKVGNSHFCNIVKPQANYFLRRLVRVRMESRIRSIWVWPKLSSLTSLNFLSFSDLTEITSYDLIGNILCKNHIKGRTEDAFTDLVSSSYNPHTDGWHHRS